MTPEDQVIDHSNEAASDAFADAILDAIEKGNTYSKEVRTIWDGYKKALKKCKSKSDVQTIGDMCQMEMYNLICELKMNKEYDLAAQAGLLAKQMQKNGYSFRSHSTFQEDMSKGGLISPFYSTLSNIQWFYS